MTWSLWLGFFVAAIVIAVTPGPGAVLSMSTGMRHGYRATLVAIFGLQAALALHLAIVAVGLGALLAASEAAFTAVKVAGAAYLVWLGIQRWRGSSPAGATQSSAAGRGLFLQGVLVNLTNPKAIVFIAALVPQFVDTALPLVPQYLLIGATLCLTDVFVMSCYAIAAARIGRWLADPHALRVQNKVFGGLFVSAGALLAASANPA